MTYDSRVRRAGEPDPRLYCACRHLRLQHGRTDYQRSREGCWWCDCTEEHAEYRAAVERIREAS